MLMELPNGDWVDPAVIVGVRLMIDREFGPRVALDTVQQQALHFIRFDDAEAAQGWVRQFAEQCNAQKRSETAPE